MRQLRAADKLDRRTLIDHLLERISDFADELAASGAASLQVAIAKRHALDRLDVDDDESARVLARIERSVALMDTQLRDQLDIASIRAVTCPWSATGIGSPH